jgi:RimJ/RimL family protein N-acetyltransferase
MRALPKNFRPSSLPLSLKFGADRCRLRHLRPDDVSRVIEFFHSHSAETIQQRYGYHLTQMSPERAARLTGTDQPRDAALGLLERPGRQSRLVAIGRYCLRPDGESAEMAFVVHEQRRRLGMATVLLEALIAIARQHQLKRLVAQTQGDNYAMLRIFLKHGAHLQALEGTDGLEVTLEL